MVNKFVTPPAGKKMFLPMSSVWLAALCLACTVGSTSGGSIRMTECPAGGPQPTYRWVTNERDKLELWVEGAGSCVTLSDIYRDFDEAPLVPMTTAGDEVEEETGIWLLTENLFMESGTTLLLHDDLGCDELKLISSSSHIIQLRSHGAYISLLRTKVVSWNRSGGTYAETDDKGKAQRSFLSIVSEMIHSSDTCDGAADDNAGEARMDIINSEVGYLGYQAAEAYGISYKVRGYCKDKSNPEVFDRVNVRGDIRFSDIHHNWFGMYSYGHQDGLWEYNLMHHSGYYGFDPHDDSDNLRIHNNLVYDNGNHGIIASKRCNDVSIQNNEVYRSAGHGIMLHRSSDNAIVRNNTVVGSGTACIALFESYDIEVSGNVCEGNVHGIRLSLGSSDNKIFDNQVLNTEDRALWLYVGSDEPEASASTDGRPTDNLFQNNHVENSPYGVVDKGGRGSRWIGNTFLGIEESEWEDADGTVWKDNTVNSDTEMKLTDTCVESGSDTQQIEDAGGDFSTC